MDVVLDVRGVFHLIFFGGDETEANIYYTQASVIQAGQAPAWPSPVLVGEAANNPELGAMVLDDEGNLAIIYSGRQEGWGLYTLYSSDTGETWTQPTLTFPTYAEFFPGFVDLHQGQSGLIMLSGT